MIMARQRKDITEIIGQDPEYLPEPPDLNQSQGEMHIRRIPSNRRRTDFNVRAVELYLAAATRPHHLRNVDPTLALV